MMEDYKKKRYPLKFSKGNFVVAEKVLKEVRHLARHKKARFGDDLALVYPFHNGRENGYGITLYKKDENKSIFFTEHRNSDSIRVTESKASLPEWQYVTYQEYKDSKFFPPDEIRTVAKYVLKKVL